MQKKTEQRTESKKMEFKKMLKKKLSFVPE